MVPRPAEEKKEQSVPQPAKLEEGLPQLAIEFHQFIVKYFCVFLAI